MFFEAGLFCIVFYISKCYRHRFCIVFYSRSCFFVRAWPLERPVLYCKKQCFVQIQFSTLMLMLFILSILASWPDRSRDFLIVLLFAAPIMPEPGSRPNFLHPTPFMSWDSWSRRMPPLSHVSPFQHELQFWWPLWYFWAPGCGISYCAQRIRDRLYIFCRTRLRVASQATPILFWRPQKCCSVAWK